MCYSIDQNKPSTLYLKPLINTKECQQTRACLSPGKVWRTSLNVSKTEMTSSVLLMLEWNESVGGFRPWPFSADTVWGRLCRPTGWGEACRRRCGHTEPSSPRRNSGSSAAGGRNIRDKCSGENKSANPRTSPNGLVYYRFFCKFEWYRPQKTWVSRAHRNLPWALWRSTGMFSLYKLCGPRCQRLVSH